MGNFVDLTGKVALVTGAGSGIGRATARQLADLGAAVVATDINGSSADETLAKLPGDGHCAFEHDVADPDAWSRIADEVGARFARLDILVNNAGIMLSRPFEDAPIDHLRNQYRINVEGPFLGIQACLPLLKATSAREGSAAIINISSVYGTVAGESFAAYSASKGAVRMLSRAVAAELAATGIRVNCLFPGPVQTNLGTDFDPPLGPDGTPLSGEEILAVWARKIPIGRMGKAKEIASAVAFLASDAASFMLGAEVAVDGGYSAI